MTRYRSYYATKDTDDGADMFEEYDPTPYEGGYDMGLTYGRPLQPTEKTCYRHSSGSASNDYNEPEFPYARPSHEVDQYNIRKQNLGGGKEKGYGGGRKSGSFDDEESTPAGEGGYGRKKYSTSPGGSRSSWWPGCCTSDQAIQ
ncbi:hypothetical protein D8674_036154 [Pyrus ussuriensis x Pyrus communis]|uniref:Uncharacterized protein n=1 Tax=Pyrus ussuriensis x Pyrus communis TaxID=2448454 RepID=A0A5N5GEV9_9ROSA|nr:hypothetical protein D8674_036154 [Pyrus ussuriensis x Pyrus communis]